ncbi:MAG: hypothetical protein JSS24_05485 [Proteobacteria bacterium]|nr:hypothetical protein [Pseudomonadota bacterium]
MAFAIQELDTKQHDRAGFDCGVEPLNRYLKQLAAPHRGKGIATTFVLVDSDQPAKILGYYSLSVATLLFEQLTDTDRKGLPTYPMCSCRSCICKARRHSEQMTPETHPAAVAELAVAVMDGVTLAVAHVQGYA